MNVYTRLGKNTLLIFIGSFGSKAITFLMLPLYVLWLSPEGYGAMDLINTYNLFLYQIASLAISEAIYVFPKNSTTRSQAEYYSTGFIYTVFTFILTALFFCLILKILDSQNVTNTFTQYPWYIYSVMFFTFVHNYNQQFCRSIDRIKVYAFSGTLNTALIALFSFLLIPKHGVLGYIWTSILSYFISSIYTFYFGGIASGFITKNIKHEFAKKLLMYSVPLIPNSIMWWVINALNRPIIEHYEGLKMVGAYAVSNKIPSIIYLVFSIFLYSWQITAFEEFNKKNYIETFNRILRLLSVILVIISCMISVFSKGIIHLISSGLYTNTWDLIPIISLGVVFASFSGFIGVNFSAIKKSKYFFYSSFWGGLISFILNLILIPRLGVIGAAIASTISYFVILIFRVVYSNKIVQITNPLNYLSLILINIIVLFMCVIHQKPFINFTIASMFFLVYFIFSKQTTNDINLIIKKISVLFNYDKKPS